MLCFCGAIDHGDDVMLACCLTNEVWSGMYGGLFETVILISRKHVVKHMTINQVAINHHLTLQQ